MLRSRIREIRKAKGLTLQEVANRIGTTAQTIGRLETGTRTLSIKWVRRIAEALETDPGELLALSSGGDIEIYGVAQSNGRVKFGANDSLALRFDPDTHVALKIGESCGAYAKGDIVVLRQLDTNKWDRGLGNDCIVTLKDKSVIFGRLAQLKGSTATLIGIAPGAAPMAVTDIQNIAAANMLVRRLGT